MITGCPVIALNVSSVPEVAANGGILIDDANASTIYQKLKKLENSTLRKDIFERAIINAKRFSWERCYKQTLSFYSKILNK
jgi:mannosyltransferase